MKRADPKTTKQQELMEKILNDPKYRGKHVIVVAGEVFTANTGEGAGKILDEVDKKYPDEIPAVTYIPDADTLACQEMASSLDDRGFGSRLHASPTIYGAAT